MMPEAKMTSSSRADSACTNATGTLRRPNPQTRPADARPAELGLVAPGASPI
jgi:hypothetical protein